MTSLLAAFLVLGSHGFQQEPEQFLGARAVLSRMLTPLSGSVLSDPRILLVDDLDSFARRIPELTARDAAAQWLALLRRTWSFTTNDTFGTHGSQFFQVLAALPGPDAWPLIADQIKAEDGYGNGRIPYLKLLFQILQGDNAGAQATLAAMDTEYYDLGQIKVLAAIRMHDADALIAALKAEPPMRGMRGGPYRDASDLVALLGVSRAKELLTYFLLNDKAELSFDRRESSGLYSDRATADLAREFAMANVGELAYPQWTLASSPDAGDLFERLSTRFPRINYGIGQGNPLMWSTIQGAQVHCLINLFTAGRTREAKALGEKYADSLSLSEFGEAGRGNLADHLIQTGKIAPFLDFLAELALTHPNSQLPNLYTSFAEGNIPPAGVEKFLRRLLAGSKPLDNKSWAEGSLQNILLAQGKLQEVAKMLGVPKKGVLGFFDYDESVLIEALGTELHRPDLIKLGQGRHEKTVESHLDFLSDDDILAEVKHGRGPAIEKWYIENLRSSSPKTGTDNSQMDARGALGLVRFYTLIRRYQDAVTLLDKFPGWNSPDIRWVRGADDPDFDAAAKALAHVGRRDEALSIIRFELDRTPDDDEACRLLLEFDPEHCTETLSKLATQYPCEQRPLIYLAEFALRQGRLHEAEKLARQAVELNPQDMQRWPGKSAFQAQKVFAAILKKEGYGDEARNLEKYSRVAELVERASDLAEMCLLGPACRLYRLATGIAPELFEPRYQLGICEIHQGFMDDGRRDIAAACNLLPSSSGRMEWSPFATLLTTQVTRFAVHEALNALVKRGTKNPTIISSLGSLYLGDGDTASAARYFRMAVDIDPNCLMAWSGLSSLMNIIPNDLANRVTSNCIRLGSRPSLFSAETVQDYSECWRQSALAASRRLDIPPSLFTLRASRDILTHSPNSNYVDSRTGPGSTPNYDLPAVRIANDPLVKSIGYALERQ